MGLADAGLRDLGLEGRKTMKYNRMPSGFEPG
jgi:hypothetical protein